MKGNQTPTCIHCGRDDSRVPLLVINYQESQFWICSEHFPILLHNPGKLAGKLPNAENLAPAEHE
jgi:hypothetical protein